MDFQKAFDKVPHERLLKKLSCHGPEGKSLLWTKSWLGSKRFGNEEKLAQGPQGYMSMRISFNTFITDLEKRETVKSQSLQMKLNHSE